MQNFKNKFSNPDGTKLGTLQKCIRTNDLSLLGDGTHLSSFDMLGNFHFGYPGDKDNYKNAVHLWHEIINELSIPVTSIHVHPSQKEHKQLWLELGYTIFLDEECVWSDGEIGGYSTEFYVDNLEVGNLVNTLGYSVDVGIGWERLIQVLEGKNRVDETSLFDQGLHPILRDVSRTLDLFWDLQLQPSWKGRNQVCRDLLRKILPLLPNDKVFKWSSWVDSERKAISDKVKMGKRVFYRHRDKPIEWFKTTYGISTDEYQEIKEYFTENGVIVRRTTDG